MPDYTQKSRDGGLPLVFAVGIEDTFIPQTNGHLRMLDEYELTGHYERLEADIGLAAKSGAKAIRYGIPWYRVNPEQGQWDWEWADRAVDQIFSAGLEPIVDLMHYGCPLWLDREFDNPDYPKAVAEYGAAVASRYGDRIRMWTPMNEPLLNALFCGMEGRWPPGLSGDRGFVRMVGQLGRGIVETQQAIADVTVEPLFVHVEATFRYTGKATSEAQMHLLRERNWLFYDLLMGRVDSAHELWRYLIEFGFTEDQASFHSDQTAIPDVMGINYYPHLTTRALSPDGTCRYEWGGTGGFDELARSFYSRYHIPLFWTESSVAGSVETRLEWLTDSLNLVGRLREDDIPVVGYTWWPLFSLVDWDYRESGRLAQELLVHMGLADLEATIDGMGWVETPVLDAFRNMAERLGDPVDTLFS